MTGFVMYSDDLTDHCVWLWRERTGGELMSCVVVSRQTKSGGVEYFRGNAKTRVESLDQLLP